ncbi:hypothetical protein SCHPADRAFT_940491 [Schizopora paradoxa]|uniref:Uncharacterized protein n=1 Tax=Schizopora paradoxa TaxID=27342 RepID=A0A0H2RV64_9AGAM|nr:hypothetical protein SCHPADRAFT_940491 [Schizopora paradoxa]
MSEDLTAAPDLTLDDHNEVMIDDNVSGDKNVTGEFSPGTHASLKDIPQVELGESEAKASTTEGANIDDEDEDEDEDEDDDSEEYSTEHDAEKVTESQFKPKGPPDRRTAGPRPPPPQPKKK